MKQVFLGEIYEVMPLNEGLLFSYRKDTIDENIVVAYKMVSFDTGRFTDVAKNIYLVTKFGNNYKAVVTNCDNYITVKSIVLPNGKVFLLSTDGAAQLLDTDATPIWKGDMTYRRNTPSDIVLYNNSLWASYPESNALLRYNLATMREELRIGGTKSPFDKPRSMFLEGNCVTVSNQGSGKLVKVNLDEYTVEECESFEEPLYQYVKVGQNRFVVLESGIYYIS